MSQKFLNSVEVSGQVSAEYLDLSTTTTRVVDAGEIAWNSIDGTFDIGLLNGVTLQAGQEMHFYGKATEAISNGNAVMFAGVQGDHILIAKADAVTINANPEYFMGVATQDFATNDFGYVTAFGNVRGIDTSAYSLGDILYYDSTTGIDGLLTSTIPSAPKAKIIVAAVVKVHATQGILAVRPHTMPRLKDIQDINVDTATAGEILQLQSDGVWESRTLSDAGIVSGSGTTNYVSKFTGATSLGNSQIFDNGTNVGIGTTSPASKLHVIGNVYTSTGYIAAGNSYMNSIGNTSTNNNANLSLTTSGVRTSRNVADSNTVFAITNLNASSTGAIQTWNNSAGELMRVTQNGNVGIGTSSPSTKLHIEGSLKQQNKAYYNTIQSVGTLGTVKWTLQDSNGSNVTTSSTNKVYRVQLVTTGTGTNTGATWIASNVDAAGWSVSIVTANTASGSNYPYMIVDTDGLPKVTTYHPGNYNVSISVEEFDGNNSGTTTGVFGLDEYIAAIGGNVGIGTRSPSQKLDVVGNINVSATATATTLVATGSAAVGLTTNNNGARILINGTNVSRNFQVANNWNVGGSFEITPSTTVGGSTFTTPAFVLNGTTGNVGIGTTSPTSKLQVYGEISTNYQSVDFGTGGVRTFADMIGSSKLARIGTVSGGDTLTGEQGALGLYIRGSEKVRINVNGDVGIGTTNPSAKLDVNGNIKYNGDIFPNTTGRASILNETPTSNNPNIVPNNSFLSTGLGGDSGNLALIMFGNPAVYVNSSSNVGIATTTIQGRFHVYQPTSLGGTAGNSLILQTLQNTGGASGNAVYIKDYAYRDATGTDWLTWRSHNSIDIDGSHNTPGTNTRTFWERDPLSELHIFGSATRKVLNIDASSNQRVGINVTAPSYPLHVSGNVSNISIYATNDIVAFSDQSVKTNIRPIENALQRVVQSRGVLYDRTDSENKDNIGFIAQELEVAFPELVITNEDGTKAVKYQNTVAVLFEAIKEQQKQIEELKQIVNGFTN